MVGEWVVECSMQVRVRDAGVPKECLGLTLLRPSPLYRRQGT
jgi:hypothetical protein